MELAFLTRLCDLLDHLDLGGYGERHSCSPCPIFPLSPKHTSLPYGIITLEESIRQTSFSPGLRRACLLISLSLWEKPDLFSFLYKRFIAIHNCLAGFRFEGMEAQGLYKAWVHEESSGRIEQTKRETSMSLTSRYFLKIRY